MKKIFSYRMHSLKTKIIFLFVILILVSTICVMISADYIYRNASLSRLNAYIGDTNQQTSINVQSYISSMDDITFNVLSNSIIQQQLQAANKEGLSEYEDLNISKAIIAELEKDALYNRNIVSLTVISNNSKEYTVQKISGRKIVMSNTIEELYERNGSAVWNIDNETNYICTARAILSLSSMKVIGYVNLVCEKEYFNDVLEDISKSYSNGCYLVDGNNTIVSSNNEHWIEKQFPVIGNELNQTSKMITLEGINVFVYIGNQLNNGWKIVTTIPFSELTNDVNNFRWTVVIIGIVAIIIVVIATILMTYQLTKPTNALLLSMKQFGKGDLKERVNIDTEDEIGKIAEAYNQMANNIETLVDKVFGMEIMQKQAEIENLKMQINPHFLYNTLDTISWTAMISGNDDVSEMAIILGNLLRANIKNESFITIEDELKTVKDYLTIQNYRFGDKITFSYKLDKNVMNYIMPNFILQPLIENAIIHGLEPKVENGNLIIEIQKMENKIFFSVLDDGVGMSLQEINELYEKCKNEDSHSSIGLKNVYRRLTLYYGDNSEFTIESKNKKGTKISFSIPVEEYHKQHFLRKNSAQHGNEEMK